MTAALTTPREAVAAMIAAGAEFSIHSRNDGLPANFTYSLRPGGDRERCREILAEIKRKPVQFVTAFRLRVAEIAERGAA